MNRTLALLSAVAMLASASLAAPAAAQPTWTVEVTNLTASQIFSPPLVVAHNFRADLFEVGRPATPGLAAIAEDASYDMMMAALAANPFVGDLALGSGAILPGETGTVQIQAGGPTSRISVVGMLVTTNDAFYGLDSYFVGGSGAHMLTVPAWDAGSEANTESCDDIPGPPCGSHGIRVTEGAEGFVHIHRGLQGVGDLSGDYDWRNPVARIRILLQ